MGEKGEGFSGICMKDTWTKPKWVGLRMGSGDDWGGGEEVRGKWRQLYLNNNKTINKLKIKKINHKKGKREKEKRNNRTIQSCFRLSLEMRE